MKIEKEEEQSKRDETHTATCLKERLNLKFGKNIFLNKITFFRCFFVFMGTCEINSVWTHGLMNIFSEPC